MQAAPAAAPPAPPLRCGRADAGAACPHVPACDAAPPAVEPLLDPHRALDYNLPFARFFDAPRNDGIGAFRPDAAWNQYFYAEGTVRAMAAEVALAARADAAAGGRVAYVCTPSLFLARAAGSAAASAADGDVLLEIDDAAFGHLPGFVRFDLAAPDALPDALRGAFAVVVLDPPLISERAWRLAARTAQLLLGARGGRVLATTVASNAGLLAELFPGMVPVRFLPEIEHLVHAFHCYANFPPAVLCEENADAPGDGRVLPQ